MKQKRRNGECFVLAGGFQDAMEVLPSAAAAADEAPVLGAWSNGCRGYALAQARRAQEADAPERSLERAVGIEAEYEVALTLQAWPGRELRGPKAEAEDKRSSSGLGGSRHRVRCPDSARLIGIR